MKRLLVVLPAAVLVSSCSVMDILGPRPNAEIMALAKQASADGISLIGDGADPATAATLRRTQADQLVEEARRLCGTDSSGQAPTSCPTGYGDTDLPAGAVDEASLIDQVRAGAVAAAEKVPDDSVDLVVAQAVDVVALQPVDLSGDSSDSSVSSVSVSDTSDLAAAHALLHREFAVEYGLDMAAAFADSELAARIEALRAASMQRRAALTAILEPSGDVPLPAAGYELVTGGAPTGTEQARALVDELHSQLVTAWREAAADALSATWRRAAIDLAAHAQRS
ncbi:hypothetical protein CAPI_04565 [Corynebacterium capitovis DSM 44611]|uniref:hypothetical protein n=1 Tax=Corynebacterium capitovis TaxID=131081 RepID=UPI001FE1D786|nr:hypothetical protein [Corynebacterium capitovis]WKD57471.1 hypothetical protein CAPI_04565 [Corynebacterium capitovis DSM 44611]